MYHTVHPFLFGFRSSPDEVAIDSDAYRWQDDEKYRKGQVLLVDFDGKFG